MDAKSTLTMKRLMNSPKTSSPEQPPCFSTFGRSARAAILTLRAVVEKVKLYKAWHLVEKSAVRSFGNNRAARTARSAFSSTDHSHVAVLLGSSTFQHALSLTLQSGRLAPRCALVSTIDRRITVRWT